MWLLLLFTIPRCANNELNDIVSDLLCALLTRLTDLEQHEEDLRASLSLSTAASSAQLVVSEELFAVQTIRVNLLGLFSIQGQKKWVSSTHLAQLLSRIERKLAKHVGAEEFLQCNANVLNKATSGNEQLDGNVSLSAPIGVQGPKKTCNLETYLDWSWKLKMLVANDILKVRNLGGGEI